METFDTPIPIEPIGNDQCLNYIRSNLVLSLSQVTTTNECSLSRAC